MEATRVTVDEVKQRMDRGEVFTFVDTRNPKAWGEAKTKLPGAIRIPQKKWNSISTKFRGTAASLPTVRDHMKHPAPVWRKHCWNTVGRMSIRCSRASMPGRTPDFQWTLNSKAKLFLHVTVRGGGCFLRTAAILTRAQVGRVPVPPLMRAVRLLITIVVLGRFVEEICKGCDVHGA